MKVRRVRASRVEGSKGYGFKEKGSKGKGFKREGSKG